MKLTVFVILILFALGCQSIAFEPGPPIVRECPKCKVSIEQPTMASGNTFGARFWTDGECEAPMFPDYLSFVKCPKCKHLFWISEAEKVEGADENTAVLAFDYIEPSESDYYKAVAAEKDKAKQKYLRIRGWRASNDQWRKQPDVKEAKLSPEAKSNMNALSALLKESNPEERLLKAEIARELGKFDQCLKLLEFKFSRNLSDTASFIKSLAEKKCAVVREIVADDQKEEKAGQQ